MKCAALLTRDAIILPSCMQAADWQTPCEVCGRTYPHEHIRSIYSSHQHDSSDEAE